MNLSKGKIYNIRKKIERSIAKAKKFHVSRIASETYGVEFNDDENKWEAMTECCPMGAVIVDRQPPKPKGFQNLTGNLQKVAAKALGLREKDVAAFVDGFDDPCRGAKSKSKFCRLGVKLREKYDPKGYKYELEYSNHD